MKKNVFFSRVICLALALMLASCTNGNTNDTTAADSGTAVETPADSTEETKTDETDPADTWKPMSDEELVEVMMQEAQTITDFIREKNFIYGNAHFNPGVNWREFDVTKAVDPGERILACDRLVHWVLYKAGFTDQTWLYGISDFDKYAEEHGFTRINSLREVKKGDLVSVFPDKNGSPTHIFICAGDNLRYDAGSIERISGKKGKQPFKEPILGFCFAWRPTAKFMPNPYIMDKLYEIPETTVASISENAVELAKEADADNTFTVNNQYTVSEGYSSYEFHCNIQTKPSSTDTTAWTGTYIGARIPTRRDTPSASTYTGGIWIGLDGSDTANLCLSSRRATMKLPEKTDTPHKFTVVDTEDTIKFYMETSAGEQVLFCTVNVCDEYDQIAVYDMNNELIYYNPINIESTGFFKVWTFGSDMNCTDISMKGVKIN